MSNETTPKPVAREYLEALLIAFARTFVFQAFKIPSGSMEENLLISDNILVNKFIYGPRASGGTAGIGAILGPAVTVRFRTRT
jgi:signal peptidase I